MVSLCFSFYSLILLQLQYLNKMIDEWGNKKKNESDTNLKTSSKYQQFDITTKYPS